MPPDSGPSAPPPETALEGLERRIAETNDHIASIEKTIAQRQARGLDTPDHTQVLNWLKQSLRIMTEYAEELRRPRRH